VKAKITKNVLVRFTSNNTFNFKAIQIWAMDDFHGYDVTSFLQTQGFYGCLFYGLEEMPLFSFLKLKKVIYHGYWKFLPFKHRWRLNDCIKIFNGKG
jgi:hypothetical protein